MTAVAALLTWIVVAGWLGPRLLRRLSFLDAPAGGILAWQALCASALMAFVFAALALTGGVLDLGHAVARATQWCEVAVQAGLPSLQGPWAPAAGLALLLLGVGPVAARATVTIGDNRRQRRAWRAALPVIGAADTDHGIYVVPHSATAAYCVPGRRPQIVLTTAAADALDHRQLHAVLDHERAHLRWRHHGLLAWTSVLARSLGRVPLFRAAHTEIARLAELMADDAATSDRRALAGALAAFAGRGTDGRDDIGAPAIDTGIEERMARLEGGRSGRRLTAFAGSVMASAAALLVPAAIWVGPAVAASLASPCHVTLHCI